MREQLKSGKLQALLNGQFQALGPSLLTGGGDGRGDESERRDKVIQSGNGGPGNVRIVDAEPLVLTIDIFG